MGWTGSVCLRVCYRTEYGFSAALSVPRGLLSQSCENFTCSNSVCSTGEATTCPTGHDLHEQQEHIKKSSLHYTRCPPSSWCPQPAQLPSTLNAAA